MYAVGKLIVYCVFAYAGVSMLLFFFQARLMYVPGSRELHATPERMGLEFESVNLSTADGETINGWYIPAPRARGTLLFLHGNAGNIADRLESIMIFHRLRLNVFIIDYRGYGLSSGRATEQGTYRDGQAAWDYLLHERKTPPAEIVIFGRSLGGGIAAWLAARVPARAVILESTFTSLPDVAAEHYRFFPVRYLSRYKYDVHAALQAISMPVLIAHSREDELISFAHSRRNYEAASEPRHFLELEGRHGDGFLTTGESYVTGLDAFVQRHIEGAGQ